MSIDRSWPTVHARKIRCKPLLRNGGLRHQRLCWRYCPAGEAGHVRTLGFTPQKSAHWLVTAIAKDVLIRWLHWNQSLGRLDSAFPQQASLVQLVRIGT